MKAIIIKVGGPDEPRFQQLVGKEFRVIKQLENYFILNTKNSGIVNWDTLWAKAEIKIVEE